MEQHETAATPLGRGLAPCGPVIDGAAAEAVRAEIGEGPEVRAAWPALAPVFGAAPYLARLARSDPAGLSGLLKRDPHRSLAEIVAATAAAGALAPEEGGQALRRLKARLHLLAALADLGGVWNLGAVTGALTAFADAAVAAAMRLATKIVAPDAVVPEGEDAGPMPGLFVLALGKMGAFELNYSSDIDVSVFYEPAALPKVRQLEPEVAATRYVQALAGLLHERTSDGYVFRVDLRLRPDPASTPPAVPIAQALEYYHSVGQNWERAALIKARVCAGDLPLGEAFLEELQPFIWRRNLDFAAIADIHSIKRQIQDLKPEARLAAPGADLKLGPGGIREIEFFVQTQQLILGGRQPELRRPETLGALEALAASGHVAADAAAELTEAYTRLRAIEHRIQMVADEQTHSLPRAEPDRRRVAALCGSGDLRRFDQQVVRTLKAVARRYGELFAGEEPLSSRFGSLVFTGVEDDPQTLSTLARMGFSDPARVAAAVRGWHHGHVRATRTERGRELFTRLAPRLLDALAATGAPDAAFDRFATFFSGLAAGVQTQSLFLAQPRLMELVVRVMAIAPALGAVLARRPAALDAMLDPDFFAPLRPIDDPPDALAGAQGFEAAMDAARRLHRERAFQIGLQVLAGTASAPAAGEAFADLADVCIRGLARAALAEVERQAGGFPGQVAVIALGKCGSREMAATSDLDLMTLYEPEAPDGASGERGWAAETFYARFTQRLITALSAPTAEGGLYEVDMKLRPSGTQGPVAVSFAAFESYYRGEAETWEHQALTCARVVWATSDGFRARAASAIAARLRAPRDVARTAADVLAMRNLVRRERPPHGFWDFKLQDGGLMDIEFAAQFLQLAGAAQGGPLRQNTGEALDALAAAHAAPSELIGRLLDAWRLQSNLRQLVRVALAEGDDPERETKALGVLLAKAAGVRDRRALRSAVAARRREAHTAFHALVSAHERR